MIYLIILAAVRKGYKGSTTFRILTCDNLVAGTTSLCLQTWRNDTVPCSNFPQIPTRTTQIKKHHKLTIVNQTKGDSFEHWLVMYLPKYRFGIFFYRKKLRTAALSFFSSKCLLCHTIRHSPNVICQLPIYTHTHIIKWYSYLPLKILVHWICKKFWRHNPIPRFS